MQPKRKWFLAFFAIAYPLDQVTKLWIVDEFYYGETLTGRVEMTISRGYIASN